ncbi:polyphosphate polymerase domain-containing protein [Antiquaquibacter soli]|uniref:Polyphosphate polymerase domain-containing protein n=1 Tax=Antiquaquibacter soli TaxID=3064523 RepID=A0ABT9BSV0_9MICO|nr:polyphosphate polymerase domain-containing protein [Protaetiibacter sp. WY-16]MDO7882417.1 polyphosphate polymerase domain-containing protein [Protaetiibacter sp. WY-16]
MSAATLSSAFAALEPIDLDELVAEASLQTRVDRKYVLDRVRAEGVLQWLADGTRVLEIDGSRSLAYESVYFDTPDLLSYRLAAHARRRRFKLRTRAYLDTDRAYLEMKTRGSRSSTVKERIDYDVRDRSTLTRAGREYADAALDGLGIDPSSLALVPTLTTRYERTTLYLPGSSSRATVDTSLSWQAADGRTLRRPDLVIVETKSGSRTSEVDRLLWANGHRPSTVSKFGTGLAALNPDLPSNKWSRVLRRHFA